MNYPKVYLNYLKSNSFYLIPEIDLRLLKISREDVDALPATRTHDGRRAVTPPQEFLRSANPEGVARVCPDVIHTGSIE